MGGEDVTAIEKAKAEDRLAVLPEWLAPGREVWFWRRSWCHDDGCMDCVTAGCPFNRGLPWSSDEVRECSKRHPVLDHEAVYSAAAEFTPHGIWWSINEGEPVPAFLLDAVYFPDEEAARRHIPERVAYG